MVRLFLFTVTKIQKINLIFKYFSLKKFFLHDRAVETIGGISGIFFYSLSEIFGNKLK